MAGDRNESRIATAISTRIAVSPRATGHLVSNARAWEMFRARSARARHRSVAAGAASRTGCREAALRAAVAAGRSGPPGPHMQLDAMVRRAVAAVRQLAAVIVLLPALA